MKKLVSVILGSIFILVGSSCAAGGDSSPSASENAVIPDGYTRVDIDDEAKGINSRGSARRWTSACFREAMWDWTESTRTSPIKTSPFGRNGWNT
ncbi:MAG: hypothetical protein ACLR06_02750 [Christensenellaceae bacterium]